MWRACVKSVSGARGSRGEGEQGGGAAAAVPPAASPPPSLVAAAAATVAVSPANAQRVPGARYCADQSSSSTALASSSGSICFRERERTGEKENGREREEEAGVREVEFFFSVRRRQRFRDRSLFEIGTTIRPKAALFLLSFLPFTTISHLHQHHQLSDVWSGCGRSGRRGSLGRSSSVIICRCHRFHCISSPCRPRLLAFRPPRSDRRRRGRQTRRDERAGALEGCGRDRGRPAAAASRAGEHGKVIFFFFFLSFQVFFFSLFFFPLSHSLSLSKQRARPRQQQQQ